MATKRSPMRGVTIKKTVLIFLLLLVPGLVQADEITIITPGVVARLCPHPNCGPNAHLARIPEATELKVEGMTEKKSAHYRRSNGLKLPIKVRKDG